MGNIVPGNRFGGGAVFGGEVFLIGSLSLSSEYFVGYVRTSSATVEVNGNEVDGGSSENRIVVENGGKLALSLYF